MTARRFFFASLVVAMLLGGTLVRQRSLESLAVAPRAARVDAEVVDTQVQSGNISLEPARYWEVEED